MLNLYPNHIFFDKVVNQITHRKNKLWRFLPASCISVSGIGEIPHKETFKGQLVQILGDMSAAIKQLSDNDRRSILESAEQTMAHEFECLGSGRVQMPVIKWHEDFKTGHSWKKGVFYQGQRKLSKKGADIKVPWELSRCHHLLWLGEAYLISHDERYAIEIVDEIENWMEENPFMYSVNWNCTMDVAIRSVNWMYALGMVIDSPSVTQVLLEKVYRSLYQHGWFIFNNLERTLPFSNNHLFSDLTGLLYMSLLFNKTKRGKQWYDYVVTALYDEMRCQVLPTGVHFERSVSYHRLMTEMVVASLYLLKRNGVSVPSDIEYRAGSMLSYIQAYTKPNHLSPLVEDNDDGRFLPFVRRDFRQHDYLLDPYSAESLFLTNGVEPLSFDQVKESRLFKDAGHAVLRDKEAYLFVTNGEQSGYPSDKKTTGTHTHNDKLSFELALGNEDIIIDPGAYIYTPNPEKSFEFRSTSKHNTVVVDGEEQNFITANNVFSITKNSHSTKFRLLSDTFVEGEYRTFEGGLIHYRRIELVDDTVFLVDELKKTGNVHSAVFSFHLAPKIDVRLKDGKVKLVSETYCIDMSFDKDTDIEVVDDTVSPSYGVLNDSKTIRVKLHFDESIVLKTKLQWSSRQ